VTSLMNGISLCLSLLNSPTVIATALQR